MMDENSRLLGVKGLNDVLAAIKITINHNIEGNDHGMIMTDLIM